jgi:hypothetical protein
MQFARLHPKSDRAAVGALEVAITRHRPQREEFRIAVIAKVEHARKTGRSVAFLLPQTVGALRLGEIIHAALHSAMIDFDRGHEAEQRPGGL